MPARRAAVLAAASLLAACVPGTPDAVELSNARISNLIPKSTPSAFVQSFERLCVAPLKAGEAFEPVLRRDSYVPWKPANDRGFRAYVVDDRRPAVLVLDRPGARGCGVSALARTGQTAKVQETVARLFPEARAAKAPSGIAGVEQVWLTEGAPPYAIFTLRDGNVTRGGEYSLVIVETT